MPNQPQRRALIVGIDRYPHLPPFQQLRGCVHDAHAWGNLLTGRYGFAPDDVLVLVDATATRQGILGAFRQHLIDRARPGDLMVFSYSGHGSYTDDLEGDSPDGYDQTLVPHDGTANPVDAVPHITDDEIFELNRQLTERTGPVGLVVLIFDCCHSGTMTRGLDAVRFLPPDLPPRPARRARSLTRGWTGVHQNLWMPDAGVYVMLAACRPDEVAYEYTWQDDAGQTFVGGTLTYFCLQVLQQASGSTTYRDVFDRVAPQVSAARPQSPQMEGDVDRLVLGLERLPPEPFLLAERRAETIWLKGGAAHGVTLGSVYALHDVDAHHPDEATQLATLRVAEVQALESRTEVAAGTASLPARGRAFEVSHSYGDLRLRVALAGVAQAPDRRQQLTDILEPVGIVQLVELGQAPQILVWFLAPTAPATAADALSPPLDQVDVPTFAVADPGGQLLVNPLWADAADVVGALQADVARIGKARNILALGAAHASPLASLKLLRLLPGPDGRYEAVPVEPDAGGDRVLYEGELLAVEVTKLCDKPIYVSLFDLGLSWRIAQIWPIAGRGSERMTVDRLVLGLRDGQPLYTPSSVPSVFPPGRSFGLETFKLFATVQESDFGWLAQDHLARKVPGVAGDALSQLLALASTGLRDIDVAGQPPPSDWGTAQVTFVLQRGRRPAGS